jgi:chromosome segregation ATPase
MAARGSEESMHLEKLNLLEERLNRLIENFTRVREERNVLERSLDEKLGRMRDLEREVEELRQERDVVRERLGRLVETIERLETLETAGPGAGA